MPHDDLRLAEQSLIAEYVDEREQEQPHDVNEMPIPRRRFETKMAFGRKVTGERPEQADDQEKRTDDDVQTVEAGRQKNEAP